MSSIGVSELAIVILNVVVLLAIPTGVVLAVVAVVRRIRSLEERIRRLEQGSAGQEAGGRGHS